jgi:hypothetical protein
LYFSFCFPFQREQINTHNNSTRFRYFDIPIRSLGFCQVHRNIKELPFIILACFSKNGCSRKPITNVSTPPREKQQKRYNTKKHRYNRIKIAFAFSCVVDLQHFYTNYAHQNNIKKGYDFTMRKRPSKNGVKVKTLTPKKHDETTLYLGKAIKR